MVTQTDDILAELLATQKRLLEIEEELLANSRTAVKRQRSAMVWFVPIILLVLFSPYIPWLIGRLVEH